MLRSKRLKSTCSAEELSEEQARISADRRLHMTDLMLSGIFIQGSKFLLFLLFFPLAQQEEIWKKRLKKFKRKLKKKLKRKLKKKLKKKLKRW